MKHRYLPAMIVLILAGLACGLPGPQAAPTTAPLPATPVFLPTPFDLSSIPSPTTGAPAAAAFSGTWTGPDPDDGSTMTLTLVQSGGSLTGTYKDSYSGSIPPPGFEGSVSGTAASGSTGQITLSVQRHDGASLNLQANLALSASADELTVTVTSANAKPWVLRRQ